MHKNQDIRRLHEARGQIKQQEVDTLERNIPYVRMLLLQHDRGEFPGLQSMIYSKHTHVLSARFIGLSAQWYAHRDECLVQEGNASPNKFKCSVSTLAMKLSLGRKGFQNV